MSALFRASRDRCRRLVVDAVETSVTSVRGFSRVTSSIVHRSSLSDEQRRRVDRSETLESAFMRSDARPSDGRVSGRGRAHGRSFSTSTSETSDDQTSGRVVDVADDALSSTLPESASVKALVTAFDFVSASGEGGDGKKRSASAAAATTRRLLSRASDETLRAAIDSHRRVDVRGSRGSGKSVALARLVMRARADGWIVAYVPDGLELTRFSYFSKSAKEGCEGLWETPDCAMRVLKHIANIANEEALKSITVQGVIVKDNSVQKKGKGQSAPADEVKAKDMNLFDYAIAGSNDPEIAVDCAITVLDELRTLAKRGDHKVMLVVDQYNALFGPSDMHEVTGPRSRKNIPAKSLRMARAVIDVVDSALGDDAKHVAVTAACESVGVSKANTAASRPHESDVTIAVDTPRFSTEEITDLLREFKRVGIVSAVVDERTVQAMKALTGGNPVEIRNLASTLLR